MNCSFICRRIQNEIQVRLVLDVVGEESLPHSSQQTHGNSLWFWLFKCELLVDYWLFNILVYKLGGGVVSSRKFSIQMP